MHIDHEDFERILADIRNRIEEGIDFDGIRSIESNFDTKGMKFKSGKSSTSDGTIIVGEDNGFIAVDVSMDDGKVVSFILEGADDRRGLNNIVNWLKANYR